jgi:hypothetical protein
MASDWLEEEFRPDPPQSVGFKEESNWTTWNKVTLGAAIGGQAADIASTQSALNRGCTEANPVFGDDPSTGKMILVKSIVLGATLGITEYMYAGHEDQQEIRNWMFGTLAVVGFGAAGWNSSQDCN